jgi:hypothetical protein
MVVFEESYGESLDVKVISNRAVLVHRPVTSFLSAERRRTDMGSGYRSLSFYALQTGVSDTDLLPK